MWKRHFLATTAVAAAFFLCAASLNYFVDSSMAFGRMAELEAAAKAVAGGGMIEGPGNFDHGRYMTELIRNTKNTPDAVALGSSRAFELRAEHFGGAISFQNNGVADAGTPDIMGVIGVYLSLGRLPKHIVLVADPWTMQSNRLAWGSLEKYERLMEERMYVPRASFLPKLSFDTGRYRLLLSYDYLRRNFNSLWRPVHRLRQVAAFGGEDFGRRPDNSLAYPRENWEKNANDVRRDAEKTVLHYGVTRESLSQNPAVSKFERFMGFLKGSGAEVVLLLVPFNPAAYGKAVRDPNHGGEMALAMEYYRGLASRLGLRVVGDYDPATYGLDAGDFFDGVHPKDYSYKRFVGQPFF